MPKFNIVETIHSDRIDTVRLGNSGAGNTYGDEEVGKAVKLAATDRFVLCVAGEPIEGVISSVNDGTYDGFSIGGIKRRGLKAVTFDGLQATPGTGTIAAGDYVVVGTVTVKGTKLTGPLKVTKATDQAAARTAPFKARVLSLGAAGTGAVGTTGVVELL